MTRRKRITRGFTLIEIAVVLVLVGLLASTIAVSSGGILRGATHDEAAAQIAALDTEARVFAKRLGRPVELHLDTQLQSLILKEPAQLSAPPLSRYTMPAGHKVSQMWRVSLGERVKGEAVVIRYEPDGTAATWGLTLTSEGESDTSLTSVIAVLGMTGQFNRWESDDQVQGILAAALRRDAD